jgi:hypothetical protein
MPMTLKANSVQDQTAGGDSNRDSQTDFLLCAGLVLRIC